jgi:mono/diheme cytochrome c family protein
MKFKSATFNVVLFMSFCSVVAQKQPPILSGRQLFEKKCAKCHGKDGTKGLFGAKNLPASKLTDSELFNIIGNGKKIMPSWQKKLSMDEIGAVIEYIKTMRK